MYTETCGYCDKEIIRTESIPKSDGERIHHFCSVECRENWDEERPILADVRRGT